MNVFNALDLEVYSLDAKSMETGAPWESWRVKATPSSALVLANQQLGKIIMSFSLCNCVCINDEVFTCEAIYEMQNIIMTDLIYLISDA